MTSVIHLCPPIGKHEMPCCLKPTTEMPPGVQLTLHPEWVTCPGPPAVVAEIPGQLFLDGSEIPRARECGDS